MSANLIGHQTTVWFAPFNKLSEQDLRMIEKGAMKVIFPCRLGYSISLGAFIIPINLLDTDSIVRRIEIADRANYR